jgi:hypothetical protein
MSYVRQWERLYLFLYRYKAVFKSKRRLLKREKYPNSRCELYSITSSVVTVQIGYTRMALT